MLSGFIIQVNLSPGGVPKRPVAEAFLSPLGFEGDGHAHPNIHGGPRKAVLLVASEAVEELIARGYPLFYGALGENLTTRGIDYRALRAGMRLRAGAALIEITQVRRPCAALDIYGPGLRREIDPSREPGLSGFYGSVVHPGLVRPEDIISVVDAAV